MKRRRHFRTPKAFLLAAGACTWLAATSPAPLVLGGGHTLVPTATVVDDLGQSHVRMQHCYGGLRVWGSETIQHPGGPGRPGAPSPALWALAGTGPAVLPLDLVPTVPVPAALDTVRADLGPAGLSAQVTPLETVIFPLMADFATTPPGVAPNAVQMLRYPVGYALAYRVRAGAPDGARWDYLLDAHTGAVLTRLPLEEAATAARAVGRTLYSGTRMLDVLEQDGQYRLADVTRPDPGRLGPYGGNAVVDLGWGFSPPEQLAGRTTRSWGDGQPSSVSVAKDSGAYDTVAADAAFGLQNAWDYFRRIHGRNGYDNRGTAVQVRVHPFGAFDNAFWNGDCIQINEGLRFWPRSSPRTLAHEFAHAVTGSTAQLPSPGRPCSWRSGGTGRKGTWPTGWTTSPWCAGPRRWR